MLSVYYTIPFGFILFWHFKASLFTFLNYIVWLKITDEGRNAHMVHIVNWIRFKMVYTS